MPAIHTASTLRDKPPAVSGVELLNRSLTELRARLYAVCNRVGALANEFGAPATGNQSNPAPAEPSNTNEHMMALDMAMRDLENIVSRIDNQS